MKKFFLLIALIGSASSFAQLTQKQLKELRENTAKAESSRVQLELSIKESQRAMDSINMARFNEQNTRNLNAFLAARKEQEHKQMNRMYLRLGFTVLMIVALVIGWRRKRIKQ